MANLQELARKVENLKPEQLLQGALILIDKGQIEMAETWARIAADKLAAARLFGKAGK